MKPREDLKRSSPNAWMHLRPVLLLLAALGILLALVSVIERLPTPATHNDGSPPPPNFYPPPGMYNRVDGEFVSTLLEIQPAERRSLGGRESRSIIFTTDGTLPTLDLGTRYERPLILDMTQPSVTVIRAIEVLNGDKASVVADASYIVGMETNLPILSLITEPAGLWDSDNGIFVKPWERGREWERQVHMTYVQQAPTSLIEAPPSSSTEDLPSFGRRLSAFTEDIPSLFAEDLPSLFTEGLPSLFTEGLLTEVIDFIQRETRPHPTEVNLNVEVPAGLRVHGSGDQDPSELFETQKQSLRLYFRTQYGASRLEAPLFPAYNIQEASSPDQSYDRLLLHAGNPENFNTLLCDHLAAEVTAELGLPTAKGQFVITFINGELWGIYRLSERVDRFFLRDNLGIQNADVVQEGRAREGSDDDWDALIDWVAAHDLAAPEHYAYIQAQIDLESFTDFAALQRYFGFSPEALFAVHPRGGRWFWVYAGGTQTFARHADAASTLLTGNPAVPGTLMPSGPSDFATLLRKLLANPRYRSRFALRFADLLNTTLAAERMVPRVKRLTRTLSPDIDYEISRWPSALRAWSLSTTQWTAFATERPMWLREQFARALGVSGTATLTFSVQPPESGRVYINGMPIAANPNSPTTAGAAADTYHYFPGTEVQAVAVPTPPEGDTPSYHFVGWFITSNAEESEWVTDSPILTMTLNKTQLETPVTLVARFATAKFTADNTTPIPHDTDGVRARSSMYPAGVWPNDVIINEIWINDNGTRYASIGNRQIEGDWLELWVRRPQTIDLRGWRITDNDTKTGTAEGSLILPHIDALAAVPRNTVILIVVTESLINDFAFPEDDLDARDGRMIFYVGNGNLDVITDPGFGIGTNDDNVVLLDSDLKGVDFVAEGDRVTPHTFGVLADGVTFDTPFRNLGVDDGALFTRKAGSDQPEGWIVDPTACQSGDALCLESTNIVTPGALNPGQRGLSLETLITAISIGGLIVIGLIIVLPKLRGRTRLLSNAFHLPK